ncbi:MAG: DUF2752 domain-containing protein [Gemmataceae bacterium]|nr:DUF2752 domain-containing protein [Gemmataceae bacterium]
MRLLLLLMAAALAGVFVVASRIRPYDASGAPLTMATHTQLGMPECNFVRMFGRPCPTCGMTTSFALLVRGDLAASFRANAAGTMMALGAMGLVLWSAVAALRGAWPLRKWIEPYIVWGLIATVLLAVVRWIVVVGIPWLSGR